MEYRKGWPWKKKSHSEKVTAVLPEPTSSPPHSARLYYEQDLPRYSADYARSSIDTITPIWKQPTDEIVRHLSEKLSAALSDIAAKATLVEQHAKVAEEAIAGWEKVETDAVTLRKQLEECLEEKAALHDRVSHLDGSLRQCTRELRLVREEQEERVHEAIFKKLRHWDLARLDLEEKLVEANNWLLDVQADKMALSNSLQDVREDLCEQVNAKTAAETQVEQLRSRIETLEKKNSRMCFDLHVLNKELEMKKSEKDCARNAAEFANRQQLEAARKVAKLEGECSRLRMLLRKKLPAPDALVQMKRHADASEEEYGAEITKSRPLLVKKKNASTLDTSENLKDSDVSFERLYVAEEEKKMLREYMAKREKEFQAVGAKTSSHLLLDRSQAQKGLRKVSPNKPSRSSTRIERASSAIISTCEEESCHGDDVASTDTCTSTLFSEFSKLSLSKISPIPSGFLQLDLMDDFVEMERLASTMSPDHKAQACGNCLSLEAGKKSLEECLSKCQIELQESKQSCSELIKKLGCSEEKLAGLKAKYAANEGAMRRLQEKLHTIFEGQAIRAVNSEDPSKVNKDPSKVNRDPSLQDDESMSNDRFPSAAPCRPRSGCKVEELEEETKNMLLPSLFSIENNSVSSRDETLSSCNTSEKTRFSEVPMAAGSEVTASQEFIELKLEKETIEKGLKSAIAEIESLKCQLYESEKHINELRLELSSTEESKNHAEDELATMSASKEEMLSQIQAAEEEANQMKTMVTKVQEEFLEEHKKYMDLTEDCKNIQQELSEATQLVSTLSSQLGSMQESKEVAETKILDMDNFRAELETQLSVKVSEINLLQEELVTHKTQLEEERKQQAYAAEQDQISQQKLHMELRRGLENSSTDCKNLLQEITESEQPISTSHFQLKSAQESKEKAEIQIPVIASLNANLECRIKEMECDANLLQEKLFINTRELQEEIRHHQNAASECQQLTLSETELIVSDIYKSS